MWHRRLGHIHPNAVKKTAEMVEGIKIKDPEATGITESPCQVCSMSHAPRQISRRPVGRTFGRFGQLYYDLIEMPKESHNGHRYITHFYVSGIRFHWVYTHARKSECQNGIRAFLYLATRLLKIPLIGIHSDNERSVTADTERELEGMGFVVTHTVVHSAEMNGPGERSGGVVIHKARKLRIEGQLPEGLWPEMVYAAVYILNRTPTHLEDGSWIVPWDEARSHLDQNFVRKSDLSCLRLYGSLTYCRIPNIPRSHKLRPRAEVGFLVGYQASNVWRVWMPSSGRIQTVRDAVFDESCRWHPGIQFWREHPLPIPETRDILNDREEWRVIHHEIGLPDDWIERRIGHESEAEQSNPAPTDAESVSREPEIEDSSEDDPEEVADREATPAPTHLEAVQQYTPPPTIERPSQQSPLGHRFPAGKPATETEGVNKETTSNSTGNEDQQDDQPQQQQNELFEPEPLSESEAQLHEELATPLLAVAPRDIDLSLSPSNIIEGKRERRSTRRDDYTYLVTEDELSVEPPELLYAFATALNAEKPSRHRDDLPSAPEHWNDMVRHSNRDAFMAAAALEVRNLKSKGTFEVVDRPNDRSVQVLPLRWVFDYKFDQDGNLLKHKARLCVRGDLERVTSEEKRAATLAARTARIIFGLVAAFDWDLRQFDAVNAFLNSTLPKPVYVKPPDGSNLPKAVCWKLVKALYGLRTSPKLWQQEACSVLGKLGLTPLPEDPCVFVGKGIIVFFYVDDIILASAPDQRDRAYEIERQLHTHWELTDHGDARWFLGIRIIRDRSMKKLWLCQDAYIANMAVKFNLVNKPRVTTPMTAPDSLKPYDGTPRREYIEEFSTKLGSAQYATTITRVDAAKATARLAQFLTNPGPQHIDAIDRVITYLYHTRFWAIAYGIGSGLESIAFASDASFADNLDKTSSAGYLCQIYGGPVDWKASKLRTVTTSTTEAELLALSEAARAMQYTIRLLRHLGFRPNHEITLRCDNRQTVDLITSTNTKLHTKLKHIDIHNHWLRQEVADGRLTIRWVPTAEMAADGLTKPLTRQNHERFVQMLRLHDVRRYIED